MPSNLKFAARVIDYHVATQNRVLEVTWGKIQYKYLHADLEPTGDWRDKGDNFNARFPLHWHDVPLSFPVRIPS